MAEFFGIKDGATEREVWEETFTVQVQRDTFKKILNDLPVEIQYITNQFVK